MTRKAILLRPEPTPNPASVRFVLDRPVLERGVADFTTAAAAERSPLAHKLFALEGVSGVMLGTNFVTVTAEDPTDWVHLAQEVAEKIREHMATNEPVLVGPADEPVQREDDEIALGIIRVIDEEIRPAVAMDGGDVVFVGYENGVVRLKLRGACQGCPSAMMTLKLGIERRLQAEFPEIVAVEAVNP